MFSATIRNTAARGFSRFLLNDRGNLTMMMTVIAIPLVAGAGIAIDYGRATRAHQSLQLIADSATLAAASSQHLTGTTTQKATERVNIATDYLNAALPRVTDIVLDGQPTVAVSGYTINVAIKAKVKGSITNVLSLLHTDAQVGDGSGGDQAGTGDYKDIDVSVKSTGGWTSGLNYLCMLVLNPSAAGSLAISGTADLVSKSCSVQVNSSSLTAMTQIGASTMTAQMINVHGNYSGSAYSPTPNIGKPVVADPLATQFANDYTAAYAAATTYGTSSFSAGTTTLNPGIYTSGWRVTNNVTLNLNPGVYFIKGDTLQIKSGGTVNGLGGVTIVMTGSCTVHNCPNLDVQAQGNLNLKAPADGYFAGITLAQHPLTIPATSGSGRNSVIGGGTINLTGIMYFPAQNIYITGAGAISTGSKLFAIVADTVSIQGNGQLKIGQAADYDAAGLPALPASTDSVKSVISLK